MTRPSDQPLGEVLISEHRDPTTGQTRVRIDRADPRALISSELLEQITDGRCLPWAAVSGDQLDVITLADDHGQLFIYRLGQYDVLHNAFEMEWPD